MNVVFRFILSHTVDTGITAIGLVMLAWVTARVLRHPLSAGRRWLRQLAWAGAFFGTLLLLFGLSLRSLRVAAQVPAGWNMWITCVSITLSASLVLYMLVALVAARIPRARREHSASRRLFLHTARAAVFATPAVAAGYAVFVQRSSIGVKEVSLPVADLPKELDGLRLAQLSDIHLSPFLSEKELARAVDMANEFNAHIGLVTGDLITSAGDPLDRCIAQLSRLRTEGGIVGCLGNHEIYARAEDVTEAMAARSGIEFLRMEARQFEFGGKRLNIAGVDYQRMHHPYLPGAERLVVPGMPNLLLSHNPDVFPTAARMGFDATISGHTHGGQISVEILHQQVSVARFYTPYVYGLYRLGAASAYVTRGIGTVGVPARLGAPPEVALIRLCAT